MNKTQGIIGGLAIAGIFAAGCTAQATTPEPTVETETITAMPAPTTVAPASTDCSTTLDCSDGSFEPAWVPEPRLTEAELVKVTIDAAYTNAEFRQFCYGISIMGHDAILAAFADGYGAPKAGVSAEDLFDGLSAHC